MGMTTAREQKVADSQFGGGATTWAPATWYLGLSTTAPADDGTGFTEPVGNGYQRAAVTNSAANFPPATTSDGVTRKTSGAAFTFPNPTGPWGQVAHYGWFTAATGGTPEWVGPLDAPISPRSGNTPVEFPAGMFVMVFD